MLFSLCESGEWRLVRCRHPTVSTPAARLSAETRTQIIFTRKYNGNLAASMLAASAKKNSSSTFETNLCSRWTFVQTPTVRLRHALHPDVAASLLMSRHAQRSAH